MASGQQVEQFTLLLNQHILNKTAEGSITRGEVVDLFLKLLEILNTTKVETDIDGTAEVNAIAGLFPEFTVNEDGKLIFADPLDPNADGYVAGGYVLGGYVLT